MLNTTGGTTFFSNQSTATVTTAKRESCETVNALTGLIVIPALVVIVNVILTAAVINYRSRLRQKNVYIYVSSTLVANAVFGILTMYQMTVVPSGIETNPLLPTTSTAQINWWIFRKAILPAIYLVMIGNIFLLILAIRDGANIIARSQKKNGQKYRSFRYQRNKAWILIAVIWTVPVIFALAAIAGWNCSKICHCTSGCYRLNNTQIDSPLQRCSRLWTPMTSGYMSLLVIVWVLELGVLLILIFKTLTKTIQRRRSSGVQGNAIEMRNNLAVPQSDQKANTSVNIDENGDCTIQASYQADESKDNTSSEVANSESSETVWQKRLLHYTWSRSATKELCILLVLFVVCTAPTMVVVLIDIFAPQPISTTVSFLLLSLGLTYCIICPFMLMRHLGGLKAAIEIMCVKATGTRVASKGSSLHASPSRFKV